MYPYPFESCFLITVGIVSLQGSVMNCRGINDWRGVGRNLGVTNSILDQIHEENRHQDEYKHQYMHAVTREWLRLTPSVRTERQALERLADAAQQCAEYRAAESLYKRAGRMVSL